MYIFIWKKKRRLFICGSYTNVSDHAVFPASTNNIKNFTYKISHFLFKKAFNQKDKKVE